MPQIYKKEYNPDKVEFGRLGSAIYFRASTWAVNPKVTRETFKDEFRKNFSRAMADYASISSGQMEDLCKDKTIIRRVANAERIPPMDEFGAFYDWFKPGPYYYYFHGDLAKSGDAAGFAMSHWEEDKKKVVIDFMLQLKPEPGKDLQFDRFKQLVLFLISKGFTLRKITTDGWQSSDFLQFFQNRGYNAGLFSTDRDTKAYDTLLDLLLSNRVDFYYSPIFDFEFKNLIRIGKKVDHKDFSTKDLSDAVASVVYHALSEQKPEFAIETATVPMMMVGGVEIESYRQDGVTRVNEAPSRNTPSPMDDEERIPVVTI